MEARATFLWVPCRPYLPVREMVPIFDDDCSLLLAYQQIVGGYIDEAWRVSDVEAGCSYVAYRNADARLLNLPNNERCWLSGTGAVRGNVVVAREAADGTALPMTLRLWETLV